MSNVFFSCPACGVALSHHTPGAECLCGGCGAAVLVPAVPAELAGRAPQVRCFRCGRFTPADECERRRECVSKVTRGVYGTRGGTMDVYGVVDVCRACAARSDPVDFSNPPSIRVLAFFMFWIAVFAWLFVAFMIFGACITGLGSGGQNTLPVTR